MKSPSDNSATKSVEPVLPAGSTGLGTFGGVYTPSLLTILGVIMYLRFGWIVGNVGLVNTLIIVTLSTAITFITALSVCSIATDRVVRTGGAYYMISRSLGLETGGAVGLSLYFAQALSVALYTLGFAESVVEVFPLLNQLYVALAVTILVAILALTSADVAIKAQHLIMSVIALSLISLFLGHPVASDPAVAAEIPQKESFWRVFAVFFPAVTGIMSGVNLSGDLRDPTRSIPMGTLAAVGTGYLIYMVLPIFLAMRADPASLIAEPLIMQRIAVWGPAILLGVWGATLSSAIGSIMGAPRVLQALVRDGVLPRMFSFLGTGSGHNDEPRNGTLLTLGVAIAAVCLGDLNVIAPVLTMFFLTTYLVLNVSAGIEGFLQSPSFRPSFKVPWFVSLFGAIGCFGVMVLIDARATAIAAVIVSVIYFWLQGRELQVTWGDVRRGLWLALLRQGLYQLDHADDTKNWRPHILVLSGTPSRRWSLVELADALTHNRGLITVSSVLPEGSRNVSQQQVLEKRVRGYLERRGVQALVRLVTAADPFIGARRLVESYGLGPLIPNTILLGDNSKPERRESYCQALSDFHAAKRSVLILHESNRGFGARRRIDVWWGGRQANGSLMLILAYLLKNTPGWRGMEIRVKLVVPNEAAIPAAEENLKSYMSKLRIDATGRVLEAKDRKFTKILHAESRKADMIFLGMAEPAEDCGADFAEYYERLQTMIEDLPTTLIVLAAPDFDFEEVLTEVQ